MKSNRRNFLRKAGAATIGLSLLPTIVKASALGREGYVPPGNKISMILIGSGSMGRGNLNQFLNFNDVQVVAACDVDDNQSAMAKKMVDEKYGNTDCRVYCRFQSVRFGCSGLHR